MTEGPVGTEPAEEERQPPEPPSIYVASLTDYNQGKLHGAWVDMTMPLEDIELAIRQMLERSPVLQAEGEDYGDWAIHDSENFGVVTVHEHDDLDTLHDLAEGIAEHGAAFSAWAEANEGDPERWPQFTEAYLGEYDSLTAYGEHIWEEMGWQQVVDDVLPPEVAAVHDRRCRTSGPGLVARRVDTDHAEARGRVLDIPGRRLNTLRRQGWALLWNCPK